MMDPFLSCSSGNHLCFLTSLELGCVTRLLALRIYLSNYFQEFGMDKFALSCPVLADESLLRAMKGEFLMSRGEVNWFPKILRVMCLNIK